MKNNRIIRWGRGLGFSKNYLPFYISLSVLFYLINDFCLPVLFISPGGYFGPDGAYSVSLILSAAVIFLAIPIVTPFVFRQKTADNNQGEQRGTGRKFLSLWIPLVCYVLLQQLAVGICDLFSSSLSIPFSELLLAGAVLCTTAFLWTFLCAALSFLSRSVGWYFVGFLVLNLAPLLISSGCYDIYNVQPLVTKMAWSFIPFHLFSFISAILAKPIHLLIVLAAVIGVFIGWRLCKKRPLPIPREKVFLAYRIALIVLISLSLGFYLLDPWISGYQLALGYVFSFIAVAVGAAIALAWLVFLKNKPLLPVGISFVAVALSCVLILGVIPAQSQREAFSLPKPEDVAGVEFRSNGKDCFAADEHMDECLKLHQEFLELCKKHLPEDTRRPEDAPECMADLWEWVGVRYQLKNGQPIYRSYSNLNDPAFDELHLRFLQSQVYEYALKDIQISKDEKVQMKYFCQDREKGIGGRLSQSRAEDLLQTYLEELKLADVSVLREEYETIQLEGIYETGDRVIYVPLSFTHTRELAARYTNMRISK